MNPFASPNPPARGLPVDADSDFWRDGEFLVLRDEARLPDRCVLCNQSTCKRVPVLALKQSTKGGKAVSVLGTLATVAGGMAGIGGVMAAENQPKPIRIRVGMCDADSKKIASRSKLGGALFGACMILGAAAFYSILLSGIVAICLLLLSILSFLMHLKVLRSGPKLGSYKVEGRLIWLHGVCEEYLATLPQITPRHFT